MKKLNLSLSIIIILIISCNKEIEFKPTPVDLISPEKDEINQPLNAILEWENTNRENRPYQYDIFVGESNEKLELIDSNLVFFPYVNLKYECYALKRNIKYYWKIRIKVENQYTDSEIYEFTTSEKLPSIEFLNSTIMIYPSDYTYEHRDSLIQYSRLELSGATNWTDGSYNTSVLLTDYDKYPKEGMYIAAKYCNDLIAYGYSDWYLPSAVELDSINNYLELTKKPQDIYWSSNEYENDANFGHTIEYLLPPSNLNSPYNIHNKYSNYKCRCVRKE